MSAKFMSVDGFVRRQVVDQGSKSERDAVVLDTEGGDSYVLRRKGGPAFGDGQLDDLVGQSISATGVGMNQVLIMEKWQTKG